MIFTIGHQESYDRAMREHAALGRVTYKTGQGADYPGGYAFQTAADAERRIAEAYPDRGFAVYEVDADWERDAHPSVEGWWHHLNEDWPLQPGPGRPANHRDRASRNWRESSRPGSEDLLADPARPANAGNFLPQSLRVNAAGTSRPHCVLPFILFAFRQTNMYNPIDTMIVFRYTLCNSIADALYK